MDRRAAKELVHILGWLERVREIDQRSRGKAVERWRAETYVRSE